MIKGNSITVDCGVVMIKGCKDWVLYFYEKFVNWFSHSKFCFSIQLGKCCYWNLFSAFKE